MKTTSLLSVAVLAAAMVSTAGAQTRTVAATGADHTTIADALAWFATGSNDTADPNVINITDAGIYDEAISITRPMTLQGTGSSRPVIAARPGPTQVSGDTGGADGLVITLATAGNVVLKDLIIIPSRNAAIADDLLRSGGAVETNITLDNVLLAPNNGSDAPVSVDGLTAVSLTGATVNGDDGAFLTATATSTIILRNTVITHFQNPSTGDDGLVLSAAALVHIQEGCTFSYNGRLGIQANGAAFRIDPAAGRRVAVIGNQGFAGIWFAGGGATERTIRNAVILNNGGDGIEIQNHNNPVFTLSDSIIAGNTGDGIQISSTAGTVSPATTPAINIDKVTIAGNTAAPINLIAAPGSGTAAVASAAITNSIIIGGGAPASSIIHNNTGAVSVSFSAVRNSTTNGTGAANVTLASVISDDPGFTATTGDPFAAAFYQVNTAAYGGAGTSNSPLAGGSNYAGPIPSSAKTWEIYN